MRFAAFLLATVLWVSPASAQLAPGYSGFSSAPTDASRAEYWAMMRTLGACLADFKKDQSIAFLETVPGSSAEADAFAALFANRRNRCMGNFVSASMLRGHIRGSIAEGLFEQMPEPVRQSVTTRTLAGSVEIASLHDFATCFVAGHAGDAVLFLEQTKLGTKGEIEALRQMSANFGPCLPADREVKLDPIDVRMAIAEALYHAAASSSKTASEGAN